MLALTDSGAVVLAAAIAGVPAMIAAVLAFSAQRRTTEVRTEVRANGGATMRDSVERIDGAVARVADRVDALAAETDGRHQENAAEIEKLNTELLNQNTTIGTILGIVSRLIDHLSPSVDRPDRGGT